MTSGEEIRIFALGTELELRPVSAEGYLESRKAASEYAKRFDGDIEAEKAALLAGLIYRSAYDGENRFFDSEEDVLLKLTTEELSEFGGMLYSGEIASELFNVREEAENGILMENDLTAQQDAYAQMTKTKKSEDSAGGVLDNSDRTQPANDVLTLNRRTVVINDASAENAAVERTSVRKYYRQTGMSMERISDFFQRDSRRYDGYKR